MLFEVSNITPSDLRGGKNAPVFTFLLPLNSEAQHDPSKELSSNKYAMAIVNGHLN